jgi:hypothetical protein
MKSDEPADIPLPSATGQVRGSDPAKPHDGSTAPPTGKRQALRDLRREMNDDELSNPGVQKLILDELERADAECADLRTYITRFHEADKRAAVLEEKLKTEHSLEITFGVGVGLGGAIIGLAPYFWDKEAQGILTLLLGAVLIFGATAARVVRK